MAPPLSPLQSSSAVLDHSGMTITAPDGFIRLAKDDITALPDGHIKAMAPIYGLLTFDRRFDTADGSLNVTVHAAIGSPGKEPKGGAIAFTVETDGPVLGIFDLVVASAIGGFTYVDQTTSPDERRAARKDIAVNWPFPGAVLVVRNTLPANRGWRLAVNGPTVDDLVVRGFESGAPIVARMTRTGDSVVQIVIAEDRATKV